MSDFSGVTPPSCNWWTLGLDPKLVVANFMLQKSEERKLGPPQNGSKGRLFAGMIVGAFGFLPMNRAAEAPPCPRKGNHFLRDSWAVLAANKQSGCGSKPMVSFWGRCTTHFSLFQWGLGCSLGVRAFDPWPSETSGLHAAVNMSSPAPDFSVPMATDDLWRRRAQV